jgi:uncharacterized protein YmfQ (DUF2313 family)
MAAPQWTAADYLAALQGFMPRGWIWPRDPDAVQTKALLGLVSIYQVNGERAAFLLVDGFPATTTELLPEWEATLGLPDPCAGASPSLQARRGQVVARFTNPGGQSAAYFTAYAAALGFTIVVRNDAPFRAGFGRCGDHIGGPEWGHVWSIDGGAAQTVYFRTGASAAGEPLESWGNKVLECELNALKPAHTILRFLYDLWDHPGDTWDSPDEPWA